MKGAAADIAAAGNSIDNPSTNRRMTLPPLSRKGSLVVGNEHVRDPARRSAIASAAKRVDHGVAGGWPA
jgi:hypothetical protein